MAFTKYIKKSVGRETATNSMPSVRSMLTTTPDTSLFYELEPAVVIDVIQDESHPIFKKDTGEPKIITEEWPKGFNDNKKFDYSYIGRIKARCIYSQAQKPTMELDWVVPFEGTFKEFPLVNEVVVVGKYFNNWYYFRRLNSRNFMNHSGDFRVEPRYGQNGPITAKRSPALKGAGKYSNISTSSNKYNSYLGKYFKANNMIRPLKHFEGDTVVESRFGSSVRFGCYEANPVFDKGTASGHGEKYDNDLGNPMILIRNRQRPLTSGTNDLTDETIFSHTVLEDINRDGSSIHITSGLTTSKFQHTLTGGGSGGGGKSAPKKKGGISKSMGGLAKSPIGTDAVKSVAEPTLDVAKAGTDLAVKGGKTYVDTVYGPQIAMASAAGKGDFGGAMSAGLGAAVGPAVGSQLGSRLGDMPLSSASKFVDTGGSSGASGATGSRGSSGYSGAVGVGVTVGSTGKTKAEFMDSVGKGNFSLNPTYETGIVNSVSSANKSGQNKLKETVAGKAISAASSLGIDVPGASDIGIKSADSPMFKVFKLASFGIKSICASMKKKQGKHGSKTEESLGWMLSLGINLELLMRLAAIFARLRGLKFNLGGFDLDINLQDLLLDLCDWVNQIEYGSTLADTFRNESNKHLSNKDFTKQLGNSFIKEGTYDTYARNHEGFDQQFRSLSGDVGALKASAKGLGQTSLSLQKDSKQVATMSFDPLTGLYRETPDESSATTDNQSSLESMFAGSLAPNLGKISYDTFSPEMTFDGQAGSGDGGESAYKTTSRSKATWEASRQPGYEKSTTGAASSSGGEAGATGTPGASGSSGSSSAVTTTQQEKSSDDTPNNSNTAVTTTQTESPSTLPQNPDTIDSFHTGEEITRDSLKGTPLENADTNAVALLHPEDLEVLKDTDKVEDSIKQAKKAHADKLDKSMAAVEQEVLAGGGNVVFGNQLPKLDGNQIVINSERVLISSKTQETGIYAKKKFFVATDDELTMNCIKRLVTVTKTHTSVVSPTIHLGEYITRRHPVLKGDIATAWMGGLCGWLSGHVHHDPYITTSSPAQQGSLAGLRARLPTLLSTRVFIAG